MKIDISRISTDDFERLQQLIGKRLVSVERPESCDALSCDEAVIEFEGEESE